MRMGAVIVSALLLSLAVVTLATEGEYITTGRLNSEAEVDTDSTVEAEAETEEVAFVETAATTTAQTGVCSCFPIFSSHLHLPFQPPLVTMIHVTCSLTFSLSLTITPSPYLLFSSLLSYLLPSL